MRIWWIVRGITAAVIVEWKPEGWKAYIGPFWSYKEAMEVLHVWTK